MRGQHYLSSDSDLLARLNQTRYAIVIILDTHHVDQSIAFGFSLVVCDHN